MRTKRAFVVVTSPPPFIIASFRVFYERDKRARAPGTSVNLILKQLFDKRFLLFLNICTACRPRVLFANAREKRDSFA